MTPRLPFWSVDVFVRRPKMGVFRLAYYSEIFEFIVTMTIDSVNGGNNVWIF